MWIAARSAAWAESLASTPAHSTTNSWSFPPQTREVQFDEKWAFVAKKEKNCDDTNRADDRKGDTWDHVAIDAESRLIISVVPGERTAENVVAVVEDFKRRTGGRLMNLITTDGYPAYEEAILNAYGETITPPHTGKRGRPKAPYQVAPKGLTYAVVEKTREKGRVIAIATRVVFGTIAAVMAALAMSTASRAINTSFVERQNGTDRHRNARKARKTYRFSKDWRYHESVTYLTMYVYNFCWPVRTLRIKDDEGRWQKRSPAMAAGLADHVWSISEWLTFPAVLHW
jgi:IS1 family transposase